MHIYFSGIGGAGISPLAQIALKAGHQVSGSDSQETPYLEYLRKHGITDIHVGQTSDVIAELHDRSSIDWFVRSSAVPDDNPEVIFSHEQGIKSSKRDELLNFILNEQGLKLIAIAGTHGKSTTTAMVVWLFQQLGVPVSYLLPAKTTYADLGDFIPGSEYFIYECDEFDRNFLAFEPHLSLITGVTWDHHEIFPTQEDYSNAFKEFIEQSTTTFIWDDDAERVGVESSDQVAVINPEDYPYVTRPSGLITERDQDTFRTIRGYTNRLDAALSAQGVMHALQLGDITDVLNKFEGFPGLQRRMEQIIPNLYSDYAHTPEKIKGAMSVALEMASDNGQELVVIYEPLTNRRQHYMIDAYKDCFTGAAQVYWIPSYLAREDPDQRVLEPIELITHLSDPAIAAPAERNEDLKRTIETHLSKGDMVVGMAGGGGGSLDDWLRREFLK